MPLLPVQAPPVRRPDLIDPRQTLLDEYPDGGGLQFGTVDLVTVLLRFDANFNDPAPYALPSPARMRVSAAAGLTTAW